MRILILRTGALGDVVHGLPVLTALRQAFPRPETRIGWLIERRWAPVLHEHPYLDRLIEVELKAWRHRPLAGRTRHELSALLADLDRFSADVVLDLMGNHKAGLLAVLSQAGRSIGLARRYRREPSSAFWISETVAPLGRHAVERALSVLPALGVRPEAADFGGDLLFGGRHESASSEPFLLIHPGAGWANKEYPAASWGRVARLLADRGHAIRVAGGLGEEALVDAVAEASRGAAQVIDAGDIPSLGSLLRRARLVLGGDTGPIHLAHALGTPVLSVMGPTDPATHGPFGAPRRAIALELPCSYCHQRLPGARACLLNLRPEAVAERTEEILASTAADEMTG